MILCLSSSAMAIAICSLVPMETELQVAHLAVSVGLTPEAVSIAGLNAQDAASILIRLGEATNAQATLTEARSAAQNSADQIRLLTAQVMLDPQNPELGAQLNQWEAALATSNAAIVSAESALVDAALGNLAPQARALVQRVHAGCVHGLPVEFAVAELSPEEFARLQESLVAERRAERVGIDVAAEHSAALSEARGSSPVVQAGQRCAATLAQIRIAFDAAEDR